MLLEDLSPHGLMSEAPEGATLEAAKTAMPKSAHAGYRYEAIAPLLRHTSLDGRTFHCTFGCPVSDDTVNAQVDAKDFINEKLGDLARRGLQRSLVQGVGTWIGRMLSGLVGMRGFDTIEDMADLAYKKHVHKLTMREEDERRAVVGAFETVKRRFVWDSAEAMWLGESAADTILPFDQTLAKAPIERPYDQHVLGRLLCELSILNTPDQAMSSESQALFGTWLDGSLLTVSATQAKQPLQPAELQQTSKEVRVAMLQQGWRMSMVHGAPSSAARRVLAELAKGFDVAPVELDSLEAHAAEHALYAALGASRGNHTAEVFYGELPEDLRQQAESLGVPQPRLETLRALYRRKHGDF